MADQDAPTPKGPAPDAPSKDGSTPPEEFVHARLEQEENDG